MMIILLSSSVFADGFVADESNMGINDEDSLSPSQGDDPDIIVEKPKTVTKTYYEYPVPLSIGYTEYDSQLHAWFSGTLYLQSMTVSSDHSTYYCTFSGTLTGNI